MPGLTCNACNKEFEDDSGQKLHYKSEWHRYNLKRKVAGVPGVTEVLFVARQAALAQEKNNSSQTPMLYSCSICGKGYRSDRALSQHFSSRSHVMRASQGTYQEDGKVVKPLPPRAEIKSNESKGTRIVEADESEEEWEEVGSDDEMIGEATKSVTDMNVDDSGSVDDMEESDEDVDDKNFELDPACCFMCDLEHGSIEHCIVHMHRQHGFFIPDVEFLKDPRGLLTYLGLKVKRDFMCLYCNERCHPFSSLEAVRKHMNAKGHCKVHFGDGDDEEEVELEEFYDYSSSYIDQDGKQLVGGGETESNVELAGSELIITRTFDGTVSSKTLGSREYLRYYRQKPRPSSTVDVAISSALASRYRSMGLATVQTKEQMVRLKVLKAMRRSGSGPEIMRTRVGLKNNVIRNLPKNVPH